MRHKVFAALSALLLMGGVAACGSDDEGGSGTGDSASTANKDPLKVALIPPSSGALAVFGADAVKAWEFAAEEVNAKGGVNGHKVELIKSSTDAQPANTVRAARKAVTQDGAQVHRRGHDLARARRAAAAARGHERGLDQRARQGRRADRRGLQPERVPRGPEHVDGHQRDHVELSKLPAETWAIQAVDYATGHTAAENFKKAAEAAGKKVVLEQYAPLNTTEFGSYITKLKNSGADGLFAVEYGADGVAFVNQGDQFKLFDQFDTVLGFNMVSEPLFKALGDKIVGFYNNLGYDRSGDTPMNKAFVDAWTAKEGSAPYYVEADNYLAAQIAVRGRQEGRQRRPGQGQGGHERPQLRQHRRPGDDGQGPPAGAPELRRPGRRGRRRARLEGRCRSGRLQDPSDARPGLQGVGERVLLPPWAASRAAHGLLQRTRNPT